MHELIQGIGWLLIGMVAVLTIASIQEILSGGAEAIRKKRVRAEQDKILRDGFRKMTKK